MSKRKRRPDYAIIEPISDDLKFSYGLWVEEDIATLMVSVYENGKWSVKLKKALRPVDNQ